MAVLGRLLVSSAERLDLPDFLSIDSYTQGDFKFLLKSFVGDDKPFILKGFDVINPGNAIGTQNISIRVADSVVYYPGSLAGPFFFGLEEGNLQAAPLVPELRKNATNYVYLTLTTTEAAKDTRAFWDPDKEGGEGGEFTQDVNTQTVLSVDVNVSVSSFPENTIPVCKVNVGANFIESIEDARDMMFRLGTGGLNPNPLSRYDWKDDPTSAYERQEPNTVMTNALDPNPFQGGDKNINTLKEWMDAVMTKLAELGGTTYWYEDTSVYNLINVFKDALATSIKSKGVWNSSDITPGMLTWSEDIVIQSASDLSEVIIRDGNKTLADNEVMYVDRVRDAAINTGGIAVQWFNATNYVNGQLGAFENLSKGDWIKKADDSDELYLRVEEFYAAASLGGGVTSPGNALSIKLSANYAGISESKQGSYIKGVYLDSEVDVAARNDAAIQTAAGNFYWLAMRSDTILNVSDITTTQLTFNISDDDGSRAKCDLVAHGLQDGQRITISGSTNFDGTFAVSRETDDIFYIDTSALGGPHADEAGVNGYYATVTTAARQTDDGLELESANHGLSTDQRVVISDTTNYNGDFQVYPTGNTTFTMPVSTLIANENSGTSTVVNIYVRTDIGPTKLERGENKAIGEVETANLMAFIGMDNDAQTSPNYYVTPDYNTIRAYENYNASADDNLTQRVSKLTSMMADRSQDKMIKFLPTDVDRATNTTNAAIQELTFTSLLLNVPTLNVVLPNSDNSGTAALNTTISLQTNQAAYIDIDRNDGFAIAAPTVANIDDLPLGENVFLIAVRLASTDVYLWDATVIPADNTRELGYRENIVDRQDLNLKLTEGGVWTWEDAFQGEIQTITFGSASDAGTFRLGYEGAVTADLAFNTDLATLETAVRAITGDAGLVLTGPATVDLGGVFTATFSDTAEKTLIYEDDNTLELAAASVSITVARTQTGGPTGVPTGNLINAADAYIQIPGQTDVANTISAQTIALTTDGEVAYISLNRNAGGANVRAVTVADITSVPLTNPDTYIIARRIGNDVVIGNEIYKPNQALALGEKTNNILAYIGADDINDSTPNYSESSGSFVKNNIIIDGENLTRTAKRLDQTLGSLSGISTQNANLKLVAGGVWEWNIGGNNEVQTITFDSVPTAGTWDITDGTNTTLALNFNDDANTIKTRLETDLTGITTVNVTGDYATGFVIEIVNPAYTDYPQLISDDAAIDANTTDATFITSNPTINELTLSQDAYVQIPGLDETRNTISAQTIALANDGEVAYVEVNRTPGAADVRAVTVADAASIVLTDDLIVIARRVGDNVIVGTGSFALADGERLELDAALAEINRYFGQLRIIPHPTNSQRVLITGADVTKLNNTVISQAVKNLLLNFDGAEVDFQTGSVLASDGFTPLGIDFTPVIPAAGLYRWLSITLSPGAVNADNTINGQLIVLAGSADGATQALAIKPAFSKGTQLGMVAITSADGVNVSPITAPDIRQLGVGGGGSGGEGDANELLERVKNRLDNGDYEVVTPVIFSTAEETLTDPVTTASYDVANALYTFPLGSEQFTSVQMLDSVFLSEGKDVGNIELVAYWDLDDLDASATYEVSRNGGIDYQAVTMSRIGQSDTFYATHSFADTETLSTIDTNVTEDSDAALTDTILRRAQAFTVATQTTLKQLTLNCNVLGSVDGNVCIQVVKDNGGIPSEDATDLLFESTPQDISGFAAGDNDIVVQCTIPVEAGTYHLVVKSDLEYRDSYNAGVSEFRIRANSADTTPDSTQFTTSPWVASTDGKLMFIVEGRVLDLRVRITGSTVDANLLGFAVFYDRDESFSIISQSFDRQVFVFSGDDNVDTFTITDFIPDPILMTGYEIGTGQAYRNGSWTLNGTDIEFPPNTFNKPGETITLEFLQIFKGSLQFDSRNRALLAENHLGSVDGSQDLSIAGRGIILRRPDGTLRELTINDADGIDIKSVP